LAILLIVEPRFTPLDVFGANATAENGDDQSRWTTTVVMLYMVIEKYRRGPGPVYQRAAERGRLLPDGLRPLGQPGRLIA
jgi:hypothetical protein